MDPGGVKCDVEWHASMPPRTSGDFLKLEEIRVNCEQNSLLYRVIPQGKGSCHTKNKDGVAREGCYYRKISDKDSLKFV